MATKTVLIEVDVDAKGAVTGLGKVDKGVEGVSKSTKKASKGVKSFGETIANIGKSAGIIGLIAGAFELVKNAISQNQKLMDGINTAFTAFNIVVQDVVDVVIEMYDAVTDSSEGFDALGKVMGGLVTIAITPLKLGFYSIKLGLEEAQLAWENSMFGDGDPETIKELTASISETKAAIGEVADEAIDAGKAVVDNFSEAVTEVGAAAEIATDVAVKAYNKFDLANVISTASSIENSKKLMAQLENQQTRIREQADRDAEIQRQIRDDTSNTIRTRIKANEELGRILEKQQEDELANVDKRIAALQLEQKQLGFKQERADEIYALNTERIAVEAQQAGFKSEQLTNEIGLLKEQKDAVAELSNTGLSAMAAEYDAAEKDYLAKKELAELYITDEEERKAKLLDLEKDFNGKVEDIEKAAAKKKLEIKKAEAVNSLNIASQTLGSIALFAEEGTDLAKGVAIAGVAIDVAKGLIGSLSGWASLGPFGIAGAIASSAAIVATGVKSVMDITSAGVGKKPSIGGANPAAGIAAAAATPPQFQTAADTGENQLGSTIAGAMNNTPVKAYVVSSEVTSAQSLDRNTQSNAQL